MLADAIAGAFPDIATLTVFLRNKLGIKIDDVSRDVLSVTIDALIARYEARGRAELVLMLEKFSERTNEVLSAVARNLINKLPAAPFFEAFEHGDPCQSLFPRDSALLNRDEVRIRMAELRLQNGGGARTLIVDGVRASGKTHTFELVRHVAATGAPPFRHVYVDLRGEIAGGYDAGELMKTFARKIKLNVKDMPDKQAQTSKWLRELRDWFIGELNDQDEHWWLVIDGVSQTDTMQDVRDMISLLVAEAEQNTDSLRLVLLGCADPGIIQSGKKVVIAQTVPFGGDDVKAFVRTACKRARVSIGEPLIDEAAATILSDLPDDPQRRLETIALRTDAVIRNLLKKGRE